MKLGVYAVHDLKAGVFNTPFFQLNDHVAKRAFTDLVNDPQSMLFKHPEDFNLFRLAEFDDGYGRFEETETMKYELICEGIKVKVQDENKEALR